jgi:hypothetical protein
MMFRFKLERNIDKLELIAKDAASDYFFNYQRYDVSLPKDFSIYDLGGTLLGTFTVYLDTTPHFSAYKKIGRS